MTSEIKVDTISEQTSANGVTIDGLTIKDGNIIGDVALAGTTPTFTIGDGGAEDAALIFDGNAVDYYMALDDSADNLIIGSGSTVGSNSLITIDSDGDFTLDVTGGIVLDGDDSGTISFKDGGTRYGLVQKASDNFEIQSMISDGDIVFKGNDGGATITALTLDMSAAGAATFNAGITVNGTTTVVDDISISGATPSITLTDTDDNSDCMVYQAAGNLYLEADKNSEASGSFLRIAVDDLDMVHVYNGSTVFNESSRDQDFRVESNGNTHKFMVNGGNNLVGINADPDLGSGLHIKNADSGGSGNNDADELVLENSGNTGISILSGTGSSGTISFGDSGAANRGLLTYDHSADSMKFGCNGAIQARITNGGTISLNESAPDAPSNGLTMNQGSNDGNLLTLKSSDVGHPFTNISEADTYLRIRKFDGNGGVEMDGYRAGNCAMEFNAYCSTESDTKTVNATAAMRFNTALTNGSTGANPISSNDNLCAWFNDGAAKMILDAEGDLHLDGSTAAYDAYEDAHLVRAYDLSHGKGVIDSKFDKFISYNHEKLADMRLVGREDDGTPNHFINVTGMQRLHNGAIWQQYEKTERLANAMYELAKVAVGEEKANEILKQNEIKLLN